MKIKYLGTAAAEGYPALFCQCDRCVEARRLGGKNIRSRASALVDGKILIDFGPDAFTNSIRYNINYTDIKTLLITHTHADHFHQESIGYRRGPGFAYLVDAEKLNIYGSPDIATEEMKMYSCADRDMYGYNIRVVKPFESFMAEGYKITPLKANHGTDNPYVYIIEKDGSALLYAHDTGIFPEETVEYLKNCGVKFGLVSLDCTAGTTLIDYDSHMNIPRNLETKDMLLNLGVADENTKFFVNHFSHNGENTLYEDMERVAISHGMHSTYDGLEVEF